MAKKAGITTSFTPYPAPDFELPSSDGTVVRLKDLRGHWLVLFFYPQDDTETCTKEACAFSQAMPEFARLGVKLYGVSKDDLKAHGKFIRKYGLAMPLLSDETTQTISAFGSWIEKSMYGRTYMGTDRSTFVIDPDGQVRQVWRAVRVKNHVEQVLASISAFMA
jgi:thioredoxin-dependent peroxiredoxin